MLLHSTSGKPIRLSNERWEHITKGHPELVNLKDRVLAAVEQPDRILSGNVGELLAVKEIESGKWIVVVYRELEADGFVITAFLTRRGRALDRRQQLWP
ncbi:hypothetical protein [Aggregatilinea lenta]|uniref:hypothetical protein n=1 Tax=Aggregatilinea lenta TaxID=913108 RepID=UPI000E5B907F|nr:hypothetical protein [Aggregatilinea lenta]